MASQRTLRSPVSSLPAAHISSIRAASVVKCGRIACNPDTIDKRYFKGASLAQGE